MSRESWLAVWTFTCLEAFSRLAHNGALQIVGHMKI